MKELSIEEKAKAYDKALEKIKIWQEHLYDIGDKDYADELNYIFPELKESEDEKIRKEIKQFIRSRGMSLAQSKVDSWIAWLEKQHEQKPADSKNIDLDELVIELEETIGTSPHSRETIKDFFQKAVQKYMKCLQIANGEIGRLMDENYYLKEQKPAEWSEEDEKILSDIIKDLVHPWNEYIPDRIEEEIKWLKNKLKSLRPQNWTKEDKERYISCLQKLSTGNPEQPETINSKWFKEHVYPKPQWKPSDKQIYSLDRVLSFYGKGTVTYDFVKELLEQLKKL